MACDQEGVRITSHFKTCHVSGDAGESCHVSGDAGESCPEEEDQEGRKEGNSTEELEEGKQREETFSSKLEEMKDILRVMG